MGVAVEFAGLTKRFGSLTAVDDLTLTVAPGRVTGFLGPNGSGKTTTLRMLLGLVRPTSGTAAIDGRAYADLDDPMSVVGAALEATDVHPGRSGRDHLRTIAAATGVADTRVDQLLELTGIPAFARKRAGGYSTGMRQRLALAQSLLGDPQLLILDEPANGLDPEGIRWLRGFLRHLCDDQGKTVLVSSHLLQEVEQTVDDVVIIANGRLVKQGPMADLGGHAGVLVRTSDPAALARALGDVVSEPTPDGALLVHGTDLRVIGDAALAAGLPVWELRRQETDLEALFFELTEGGNRNLGDAVSTAAVRSELLKFFTTRLWWGMAIGVFLSGAAFALLFGLLYTSSSYLEQADDNPFGGAPVGDPTQIANSVYTAGLSVGYLLMLVIGVIQIGAEYRHRTITSTFLAQPRRPRVMVGKALALVLLAAAYGVLSLVGSVLVGAITLQARGAEAFPSGLVARTLVLSLLVLGLWALIGLGAGS